MIHTKFDRRALTEVYEVLMLLEKSKLSMIPEDLVKTIKENKDNDYEVDIHEIENGKMLQDTSRILATIYTYYFATDEEKNIIKKFINLEKEKNRENYEVFKKDNQKLVQIENKTIHQRQNFLSKLMDKLKRIWRVLNEKCR